MIKSIAIDFPTYNVKQELDFIKWINIIEKFNWRWKTSVVNTIMSLYTWYFGKNSIIPEWYAKIVDDKQEYILSKKTWIGWTIQDPLARYAQVWSFFNDTKSTVEQRDILTRFLWIDRDSFLKDYINNYLISLNDSEKKYYNNVTLWLDKLKEELKISKNRESVIIDDITRLKLELLSFKEEVFEDVDKFYTDSNALEKAKDEYNKTQSENINFNNKIQNDKNNNLLKKNIIENNLKIFEKELENLNKEYIKINSSVCFNCSSAMLIPKDKLDTIQAKLDMVNKEINDIKIISDNINTKIFDKEKPIKIISDIKEASELLNITLPFISEARLEEYNSYNKYKNQLEIINRELSLKEKQLKEINTIQIQDCINIINKWIESFNKDLEVKVKSTWLNIELFETLKNWNVKSTFNIYSDDGIEYSNCSTGNKMIIEIKFALLFVKKFWFTFVIIDEASRIWKENFILLSNLLKDYQVLFFKASSWDIKDINEKI